VVLVVVVEVELPLLEAQVILLTLPLLKAMTVAHRSQEMHQGLEMVAVAVEHPLSDNKAKQPQVKAGMVVMERHLPYQGLL
jgi:hypothetical protein